MRALPETFRVDAEAAASAVVIEPARWGEHGTTRSELVAALQSAVVRHRKVRMQYAKRRGQRSERWVSPLGLVDKDDIWYLIAGTESGQRTFRVDRIVEAEVTEQPAERPPDFDLPEAWQQIVDEVEQSRGGLSATVLIEPRFVDVLHTQWCKQCEELGEHDDGRVRVRVSAPTPLMIAQQLAGWGALIDVVDSPMVRSELARIGTELADRYAGERE